MTWKAALLLVFSGALLAQGPGSVSGRVVSTSGASMSGVRVQISVGPTAADTVWTGLDGVFRFTEVKPGEYSLQAFRPSYERGGMSIAVQPGERLDALQVEMTKLSVIAGEVRDQDGLPVEGARLAAWSNRWGAGAPDLSPAEGSVSDDRGRYRLFDLERGRYVVTVTPPTQPAARGQLLYLAPPQLYPEPDANGELGWLDVGAEEVRESVDFVLGPLADTRLTGSAATTDNKALDELSFLVFRRHSGLYVPVQTDNVFMPPDGSFGVSGLAPGDYFLAMHGIATAQRGVWTGLEKFTVAPGKPATLPFRLTSGAKVTASLRLLDPPKSFFEEGGAWKGQLLIPFAYAGPRLLPGYTRLVQAESPSGLEASLEAAFGFPPGQHSLVELALPEGGYVSKARVNGEPLGRDGFSTVGDEAVRIDIQAAFDSGVVEGTVTDGGRPAPRGSLVALIPVEDDVIRANWRDDTDPDGRFRIEGVAPGRYRAYATSWRYMFDIADPQIQQQLNGTAVEVVVKAEETTPLELEFGRLTR